MLSIPPAVIAYDLRFFLRLYIQCSELLAVALSKYKNRKSSALLRNVISWYSIIKFSGSLPRGLTLKFRLLLTQCVYVLRKVKIHGSKHVVIVM